MKRLNVRNTAVFLTLIFSTLAWGVTLYPNDDTTLRGNTEYNATSPFGLFVKTANYDVSYMEYTLGTTPASEAKLVLHNDDTSVTTQWTILVNGAQYAFTEGAFNSTGTYNDGVGWAQVGSIPGVQAVAFYEMDLTSWYNANLGKTMSLFLHVNAVPNSGGGPIFEDKEGTKTGNGATFGPRIVVTEDTGTAPNPASAPNPTNGANGVALSTALSWTAGSGATSHSVYFGSTSPGTFQGNQPGTTFDPGALDEHTTYYWRIDEVNAYGTTSGTVWSFTTSGDTMWPMDDNAATSTVTETVFGYDGTFSDATGNPATSSHHSVDSREGTGSLSFDGVDDYVEISGYKGILGTASRTSMAWIKTEGSTSNIIILNWGVNASGQQWLFGVFSSGKLALYAGGPYIQTNALVTDGQWHHVAAVLEDDGSPSINEVKLYIDGIEQSVTSSGTTALNTASGPDVLFGAYEYTPGTKGFFFPGLLDDVRIYNEALSAESVYHIVYPKKAWSPLPEDDAINVDVDSDLSWSAGDGALSHDVYFGASYTAVANAQRLAGDISGNGPVDITDLLILADQWFSNPGAVTPSADIVFSGMVDLADFAALAADWNQTPDAAFMGNQTGTSFDPGTLAEDTSCFWRIDEVNTAEADSPQTGRVWNFNTIGSYEIAFPGFGTNWETKTPVELGLNGDKLNQLASNIGGNGIIIRQGYVVKTWGSQSSKADWASAAKPVVSTMLFYAMKEGIVPSVNKKIADYGWALNTKDQPMEFYHLANMTSGYARGEAPGTRWAYNDYGINLYVKTLFDRAFGNSNANTVASDSSRLGALGFQDGSIFSSRGGYGITTSVRDFARIGWLWCNKGYWNGQQLLPKQYFDDYMKAQVPSSLPRTSSATTDYLGVGTYGGGSDQTANGPGVYGFNWWCNPNQSNWPDAPADTIQANGHWGLETVTVIPSLSVVVASYGGNMGSHDTGSSSSTMNQNLKLLTEACPPPAVAGGYIIKDPTNPTRMVYSNTYENGRLKPVCFAGPGDPEDFFYNNTAANLSLLTSRGSRCTYITAVLQDFGGGNPGTGAALDAKLEEWEGYITQMENAGIITVFFFFDDSQPLTSNWQELVDKCVAKFKHHRLLIWSVAEEYAEAISAANISAVAARIKAQDDYEHVVGVHKNAGNSFTEFLSDSNLDMFIMQLNDTTAATLHNSIRTSNANGVKILNMAEAPDHAKQTRTTVRLWNWASMMGGASAVQVLWMGRATDPADWNLQEKYDDCARLMDFMESTRINETVNRDDLARGNTDYVLANPGSVYIVYGDAGTSLGVNVAAGDYRVIWFDAIDGDWVDQGVQTLTASDQTFAKPTAIGAEAALYLEVQP